MGIEPTSSVWKTDALADVLHPQMWWTNEGLLAHLEKIGTLKKGEKIFSLFPVFILYKKFFEKSTYFLRNHRQYS